MAQESWTDLSEITFGLIITGELPVTKFTSELFSAPYDKGFENWMQIGTQTALAKCIGTNALNTALSAADTVQTESDIDWASILINKRNKYASGQVMEKLGKKLREGKDVDDTQLMELSTNIRSLANPEHIGLRDIGTCDISEWKPFRLTGWNAIDETVGGISAHRPTIVGAMTGLGKALPVSSIVSTPTGWRRMGDLIVGDYVTGSNGRPTKVVGVFPQGERNSYRVTFTDGFYVECDMNHLWNVQTKQDKDLGNGYRTLTLGEIANKGIQEGAGYKWFIPMMSSPIEFPELEHDLHPYVLGALLGNGCFRNTSPLISSSSQFLLAKFADHLPENYSLRFQGGYDYCIVEDTKAHHINKVKQTLTGLGLWNTSSNSKFIPNEYKYCSVQDRIELLHGLMDTDGYISADGSHMSYCTVSKRLADDVCELVQSLAGKAVVHIKKTTGQLAYNITVSFPNTICPFSIPEKKERFVLRKKYLPTRAIKSIEYAGICNMVCIAVDAPDQLFVIDHYVVTHNTMWTLQFLVYYLQQWPDHKVAVYSLEMSREAWRYRAENLFPKLVPYFNTGRLLVSDSAVTVTDVSLETASIGVDLIIVDYINYLIRGEITPQSMEVVNRQLNEMCRILHVPTIVLHQFSDKRIDPIPRLDHFYMGTSTANVAGLVIGLGWLRNSDEAGDTFVYDEDKPMMMYFLKSGDGFMFEQGPGAAFMHRTKNIWGSKEYRWQTAGVREFKMKGKRT